MLFIRRLRTFDSLKVRDYRLLWLGGASNSISQHMDMLSRSWLIYQLTGSPFQLGLEAAVRGIPLLIFGAVAGAVADRHGPKAQLIIAQAVNVLINVVLAALILTGQVQPWHIYLSGFFTGTSQAFQQPARQVLISQLVAERQLMNAISLLSAAGNMSHGLGPALGGIIISASGVGAAYIVQAGLLALGTLWTVQIKSSHFAAASTHQSLVNRESLTGSLKSGISYVLSNRLILALMILGLAPAITAMPFTSLMPIFAIDVFHGDAGTQGLLMMMTGIGGLTGALAIASMGRRQGNGKMMIGGVAGFGLSLLLFSQSPALSVAMLFTLLSGFFEVGYKSQNQTIIQMLVPEELRGRVLGIYMLDRGLQPVGSVLAGILASLLNGPWAVAIMGMSCFVLAIGITLLVPGLWKANLVPAR